MNFTLRRKKSQIFWSHDIFFTSLQSFHHVGGLVFCAQLSLTTEQLVALQNVQSLGFLKN
jgi:hypothetical protein